MPTWNPYQATTVVTPPFSEYFSGHSTFSAAAAEVLKRFTGSDTFGASVTIAQGTSNVEPGLVPAADLTLEWKTFSDAADEAGISRRFGGIHFADGDMAGRKVGRRIGPRPRGRRRTPTLAGSSAKSDPDWRRRVQTATAPRL